MLSFKKTANGFARTCGKCGGDGIYWLNVLTANGVSARKDVCYPCAGSGHVGKAYSSLEEMQKNDARNGKAKERREAKIQAEWEAGHEERELAKAKAELARQKLELENSRWSHLDAQIGDKVTVTGNITTAMSVETQYGTSRLIVIETAERQAVKLFTTAEWSWTADSGDAITIIGTVKSFDEYNGKAQTTLTRAKPAW